MFRKEKTFPPKSGSKKTVLTSMISAVYESNELFDSMTLKPLQVFYLDLKPSNTSPNFPVEMVFDPEWSELRGNEFRSFVSSQVIDSDAVEKAEKKSDGAIVWKEAIEERSLDQRFVVKGTFKLGLDVFGYQRDGFVVHLNLVPAKRENCVNEDFVERGVRANEGL